MSTAVLRVKKLTGRGKVRIAAQHNKRAIAAERGACSRIDATRCHLNECIGGLLTPSEIATHARTLMTAAGIEKPRKNAVLGLEFVVSLPANHRIDDRAFFTDAANWIAVRFGGADNLLSADIHRDESAPQMHVLIPPLIGGALRGSDAIGGPAKLKRLHREFREQVCARHGLRGHAKAVKGDAKGRAVASVIAALENRSDAVLKGPIWLAVRDAIERDPMPFAAALGLTIPRTPSKGSFVQTSTGRGPKVEKPYKVSTPFPTPGAAQTLCSVRVSYADDAI